MKQMIIIAVSLLTFITGVNAHPVQHCAHKQVIKTKSNYQFIVINNDIDVILTESALTDICISGGKKDIQLVRYYVKNGILFIESKNGSLKGRATVHVSVNNLKQIEINGQSTVISNGTLSSNQLKVVVNGEAKFDLKNIGDILIEADESIDLNFEKQNKEQHLFSIKIDSTTIAEADAQMDALINKTL
ncbi:MAG TPA: DUF2807 domain-containing protein [Lacibacter sp.]|nr:DUF2807 domain-containing protein [Lacibacter sp.]